jgi:hypothetical protein
MPQLHPGAVELGLSLSAVSVEGDPEWALGVRVGSFAAVTDALLGYEVGFESTHVGGVDMLDIQAGVTWQRRIGDTSTYPFLAIGGGPRQEWIGSFRQARWPVGGGAGLHVLAGERVALRTEYRYRRVLGDPVADFSEHQVWASFSLLVLNRRR